MECGYTAVDEPAGCEMWRHGLWVVPRYGYVLWITVDVLSYIYIRVVPTTDLSLKASTTGNARCNALSRMGQNFCCMSMSGEARATLVFRDACLTLTGDVGINNQFK